VCTACLEIANVAFCTPRFSRFQGWQGPHRYIFLSPTWPCSHHGCWHDSATVQAGFVSAVINAGYHVELAGGGHYNPRLCVTRSLLSSQYRTGKCLTLNALYINQRQWGFQFPQWQEMRKEGLPSKGFVSLLDPKLREG